MFSFLKLKLFGTHNLTLAKLDTLAISVSSILHNLVMRYAYEEQEVIEKLFLIFLQIIKNLIL